MAQRPQFFTVDYSHPLARGLVFAGLGRGQGGVRYLDSSSRKNHGTLTGMTPASDWVWIPELGRWGLTHTTKDTYVVCPRQFSATDRPLTCSFWYKPRVTNIARHWIVSGNQSSVPDFGITLGRKLIDSQYQFGLYSGSYTYSNYLTWRGGFQHFAVSWDTDDACRFYVDGVLNSASTRADRSTGSGNAMLGRYYTGTTTFLMDGVLCDFMFHAGRALSTPEIATLANRSDPMLSGMIKPIGHPANIYDLEGIR